MKSRRLFALTLLAMLAVCACAPAEEKLLYETKSDYNQIFVTENAEGLRTLWFEEGGAMQSVVKLGDPDYLALPYARAMPVGLAVMADPQRVLMVGLGGGSIPSFLRKHYPEMVIDIVDIDPEVVRVAKEYFGFKEDERMRVTVDDGRKFIERSPGRYDMILLDAFGADNIPYSLATREFLQGVRRALTPRGIVVANIWSSAWNPLYSSMVRTYSDVFDAVYIVDVQDSGNKIVIAIPRKETIKREELVERASALSKQRQFRFDLGAEVSYGFRTPTAEIPAGRVLLDETPPSSPPPQSSPQWRGFFD